MLLVGSSGRTRFSRVIATLSRSWSVSLVATARGLVTHLPEPRGAGQVGAQSKQPHGRPCGPHHLPATSGEDALLQGALPPRARVCAFFQGAQPLCGAACGVGMQSPLSRGEGVW